MCRAHHPACTESDPALSGTDEKYWPGAGNEGAGEPQVGLPGGSMGVRGISSMAVACPCAPTGVSPAVPVNMGAMGLSICCLVNAMSMQSQRCSCKESLPHRTRIMQVKWKQAEKDLHLPWGMLGTTCLCLLKGLAGGCWLSISPCSNSHASFFSCISWWCFCGPCGMPTTQPCILSAHRVPCQTPPPWQPRDPQPGLDPIFFWPYEGMSWFQLG